MTVEFNLEVSELGKGRFLTEFTRVLIASGKRATVACQWRYTVLLMT